MCSSAGFNRALDPPIELDPDAEKPQPGADRAPPRMNAEFVECAGVFIGEIEAAPRGLSAMRPRNRCGRDDFVTRVRVASIDDPNRERRGSAVSRRSPKWARSRPCGRWTYGPNTRCVLVTEKSFSWKNGERMRHARLETVRLDEDPPALVLCGARIAAAARCPETDSGLADQSRSASQPRHVRAGNGCPRRPADRSRYRSRRCRLRGSGPAPRAAPGPQTRRFRGRSRRRGPRPRRRAAAQARRSTTRKPG